MFITLATIIVNSALLSPESQSSVGLRMSSRYYLIVLSFLACALVGLVLCIDQNKPDWAKKDIRDYTDADLERLYEQWDEDEEQLPEDELPEHLRKAPQIDMSNLDFSNPENVLKLSKKGKTLMTFVSISGNPTREETETITSLWQSSLQNSHIIADRFIVADNRAIFMFKDGSQAWEAKDFIIQQEQCKDVTIENKVYPGKYSNAHVEL